MESGTKIQIVYHFKRSCTNHIIVFHFNEGNRSKKCEIARLTPLVNDLDYACESLLGTISISFSSLKKSFWLVGIPTLGFLSATKFRTQGLGFSISIDGKM